MTQTLDVLDIEGRLSQGDMARTAGALASAAPTTATKFGTFAIAFGIAFALLYTVFERLNWPLFTYMPVGGKVEFWKYVPRRGEGPPMYWYGWLVLSVAGALAIGWFATMVSAQWLRRATVFCCALAALWPASLAALQYFITEWATFDADFLNSVWLAAIPALVGAAAIGYFVPSRWAQRLWTGWLLIVPIAGLIVLGYSLKPWFIR
jgi:hypothetical protein